MPQGIACDRPNAIWMSIDVRSLMPRRVVGSLCRKIFGMRYSNIEPFQDTSASPVSFLVIGRPRWNQCSRSEEHTSELQSLMRISYAVFCLKKKKTTDIHM